SLPCSLFERGCPHPRELWIESCVWRMWASALVRLRWCLVEAVKVRFCAVKSRAVSNHNCVVATRGGEQWNENGQSVTPSTGQVDKVNSIRSARMGEPASAVRSLSRRVKPSGIRSAVGSNPPPPSNIPQMVGDRMARRPNTGIREIGLGTTAFMPLGGRRAAQDEVKAPAVA